jgi:hypothetical protein
LSEGFIVVVRIVGTAVAARYDALRCALNAFSVRIDVPLAIDDTVGYNIQVACNLSGRVLWVSDPVDGRRHDSAALAESGLLAPTDIDVSIHLGDKGYQGAHVITPIEKPVGRALHGAEIAFNKQDNKLRSVVERGIALLKNWKTRHTDYRRPIHTFKSTITAAIGLYFFTCPK